LSEKSSYPVGILSSFPEIEHREAKRFFLQCHELVENLTPAVGSCHAGWACKDYC
jgi:hypothetical protein